MEEAIRAKMRRVDQAIDNPLVSEPGPSGVKGDRGMIFQTIKRFPVD